MDVISDYIRLYQIEAHMEYQKRREKAGVKTSPAIDKYIDHQGTVHTVPFD